MEPLKVTNLKLNANPAMPGLCCVAVLLNYSASHVYSLKKVFTVWIFIGNKILNGYRLQIFYLRSIYQAALLSCKSNFQGHFTIKKKKNKFNYIKSSNEYHMLLTQSAEKHGNGLSKNCVFTQSMPQRSMRYQESTKVCASALKAQY